MNERDIEERINEVRRALLLDRMPSKSEIEAYYGNFSLTNVISKNGGFRYWAEKLGLKVKECESQLGYECELLVMRLLKERGYACEKMSFKHPYDLLVNGCVKIDVKAARTSQTNSSECYSFGLAKAQQTCDVYVAVCLDDNDKPKKIYVMPAHVMHGKTQLALGIERSKYDKYLNRWEIIDQLSNDFERLT